MSAADLIVAGVEVECDIQEAVRPYPELLAAIEACSTSEPAAGLREIIAMLICAAYSAADAHQEDRALANDVARIRRFVSHLTAASFEIRP